MLKVDIQQVFVSTAAVFGIGLLCLNFCERVFKTVRHLIFAPFTDKCQEDKLEIDERERELGERELDERELERLSVDFQT